MGLSAPLSPTFRAQWWRGKVGLVALRLVRGHCGESNVHSPRLREAAATASLSCLPDASALAHAICLQLMQSLDGRLAKTLALQFFNAVCACAEEMCRRRPLFRAHWRAQGRATFSEVRELPDIRQSRWPTEWFPFWLSGTWGRPPLALRLRGVWKMEARVPGSTPWMLPWPQLRISSRTLKCHRVSDYRAIAPLLAEHDCTAPETSSGQRTLQAVYR